MISCGPCLTTQNAGGARPPALTVKDLVAPRRPRPLSGETPMSALDPERTFHRSASGYPRGSRALSDLPISALTLLSLFLSGGKHQGL